MLYYTILYYTILYYTILYYTILYYTILYYTILQAWCPHLKKDIDLLEKMQRRATRLIYPLHDLPHCDRLKRLKLTTLVTWRVRGDLIQVFKIIKGFEDVDSNTFFKIASSTNHRGHSLILYKHN